MTIDLSVYIVNKKNVISYFNSRGGKNISRSIGMMASATSCPAIVIAYWIGEETGWPKEVIEHIKSLIDFYGYTRILNKPDGAPI